MTVFHSAGRIGDLLFALWTMKALGGGQLVVSDFHKGNWDLDIARSMTDFLMLQPYIKDVAVTSYVALGSIGYDFQHAETDYNPEAFGMSREEPWPGRALIAQRYAGHFGLTFDGLPWLRSATMNCDVAFHCPMRRSVREKNDWITILESLSQSGLDIVILGKEPPFDDMGRFDLVNSAQYVNGAKCFLGVVSSMNALAEGLGKKRFVEHAPDCWNVTPGVVINGMSNDEIVKHVIVACKGEALLHDSGRIPEVTQGDWHSGESSPIVGRQSSDNMDA